MGDSFQTLVDKDVTEEEAPRLAEQVRQWLVARRIIESELSDCTLGESGHPPEPAHTTALENPSLNALDHMTNGLQLQVGRNVFSTPYGELTCNACGSCFEPGDHWSDTVGFWYEGDDAITFACPSCGRSERLTEWTGEWPWGFGNLGLTFWNWPPLSARFLRELTDLMGHRTVLVRGKV